MSTAEEKNFALERIREAGMIDMLRNLFESTDWFFRHKDEFWDRGFIDIDKDSANSPGHGYYRVTLTDRGRAFLKRGGYVTEEARQIQEEKDKTLDRVSKRGTLWAAWVFGALTVVAALWGNIQNRDKINLEVEVKRINEELKVKNEQTRNLEYQVAHLDSLLKACAVFSKRRHPKNKH